MKNDAFLARTLFCKIKELHKHTEEARAFKWEDEFGKERTTVVVRTNNQGTKAHADTFYIEEFDAEILLKNIRRMERRTRELIEGKLDRESEIACLRAAIEARLAFENGWDGSLPLVLSARTARRIFKNEKTPNAALEFVLGCDLNDEIEKSKLEEDS